MAPFSFHGMVAFRLMRKPEAYIEEFLTLATLLRCWSKKKFCVITRSPSLSGTQVFGKPDLALKAGKLLKKLAFLKKGNAIRKRDSTQRQDAEDFISLYEAEWNDRVTGIARQNISERRYNKKEILPVTNGLGPVFRKVIKFNIVFEITTC